MHGQKGQHVRTTIATLSAAAAIAALSAALPTAAQAKGGRQLMEQCVDHVLSRFDAEERDVVERSVARSADAVEVFLTDGLTEAMNRYNAVERTAESEERDRP